MKKVLLTVVPFLVLLAQVVAAPHQSRVTVALVTQGELRQKQIFNGTLSFNEKSRIAAQSSGAVTKVYFDRAQNVKKGELLLGIDAQILEANLDALRGELKEAQLKLERAKIDFKRYEALFKNASIAKQKFDEFYYLKEQAKQSLLALGAKLKAQTIAWEKKQLYAPFDGMIVSRSVERGEWVKAGDEVALLVNPYKIDLLFHLPSSYVKSIKAATTLTVEINHKMYQAKVAGRLLSGDANTRTFPLLLQLYSRQNHFFEGMQARVSLGKSLGKNLLMVPRDAIIRNYDKTIVYVVKKGEAQLFNVDIIGQHGNKTAVISKGLKRGMQVVTKGNERLYSGAQVAIQ